MQRYLAWKTMADFRSALNGSPEYIYICENENYLAFLNPEPVCRGHVLVIPKTPVDDFFELDDSTLSGMMLFSKQIAQAIKKGIPCKKVGVMVAGLVVRHAHIHLIPIQSIDDLNFKNASAANDPDLKQTAQDIGIFLEPINSKRNAAVEKEKK